MTYRVFWQVPQRVLCMELEGNLSLADFKAINLAVIEHLGDENANQHVGLVVDITRPGRVPSAVTQLKESQTYLLRRDLQFICVAGNNKFMRLMMLLTFNLCRPSLKFADNFDQASTLANVILNVS